MDFQELETVNLKLISLKQEHLDALFSIYSDEESMKYWDAYPHEDLHRTQEVLNLLWDRMEKGTGMSWGIKLKESEELIGTISYNHYQENGNGFIGYILERKYWNKGLMSEALIEFVKFGFDQLKLHRIEAQVEPGNLASESLLRKVGFKKEGVFRGRAYYKGHYQDMIIYGLLKTDDLIS